MLGDGEEPRFQHKDPLVTFGLAQAKPEVLGDRAAERPSADDDEIEWPPATGSPRLKLGEIVAEITSLDVACE
jgi:hypothetical protein